MTPLGWNHPFFFLFPFYLHTIGLPLCTTAKVHQHHTTEYHEGRQHLLPTERVHPHTNADGGGNDGLHIGVHAHQGRTDSLLPYRNKEIGNKCSTHNQVRQFEKKSIGECGVFERKYLTSCKWQGKECREQEYPLHERDHRIASDERFEQPQVKRETEAIGNDEEDTL